MFPKALLSLAVLAASVSAAVQPVKRATCSNGKTTANDACCVWFDVLDDIQANLFHGGSCGENAHESLRLIFHDAIAFSPALTAAGKFGGGGADGSIMAHTDVEIQYAANDGLDDIIEAQRPFALKHNVSFGDLDSRTACEWQKMIVDRANMLQKFEQTVLKLSLLGFDKNSLTDCSDVIPTATGTVADPFLPAGRSMADIEAACSSTPFPTLSAQPGPETTIPAMCSVKRVALVERL
ncbi:heme peroxidase [Trametes polyzona]|nr:heme peroxidase [Trametes polyzona]